MILRNSHHPRGIDLGSAQNPFRVGSGASRTNRTRYRVAAQLYAKRTSVRADPGLLAIAAATVRRAIADAKAGRLSRREVSEMVDVYAEAHDLPVGTVVPLEDVEAWLRADAERFLAELHVPDLPDRRELDDAFEHLLHTLQRDPGIRAA